jgi:hypothetical protein
MVQNIARVIQSSNSVLLRITSQDHTQAPNEESNLSHPVVQPSTVVRTPTYAGTQWGFVAPQAGKPGSAPCPEYRGDSACMQDRGRRRRSARCRPRPVVAHTALLCLQLANRQAAAAALLHFTALHFHLVPATVSPLLFPDLRRRRPMCNYWPPVACGCAVNFRSLTVSLFFTLSFSSLDGDVGGAVLCACVAVAARRQAALPAWGAG